MTICEHVFAHDISASGLSTQTENSKNHITPGMLDRTGFGSACVSIGREITVRSVWAHLSLCKANLRFNQFVIVSRIVADRFAR